MPEIEPDDEARDKMWILMGRRHGRSEIVMVSRKFLRNVAQRRLIWVIVLLLWIVCGIGYYLLRGTLASR
jgi:hypothetical protein